MLSMRRKNEARELRFVPHCLSSHFNLLIVFSLYIPTILLHAVSSFFLIAPLISHNDNKLESATVSIRCENRANSRKVAIFTICIVYTILPGKGIEQHIYVEQTGIHEDTIILYVCICRNWNWRSCSLLAGPSKNGRRINISIWVRFFKVIVVVLLCHFYCVRICWALCVLILCMCGGMGHSVVAVIQCDHPANRSCDNFSFCSAWWWIRMQNAHKHIRVYSRIGKNACYACVLPRQCRERAQCNIFIHGFLVYVKNDNCTLTNVRAWRDSQASISHNQFSVSLLWLIFGNGQRSGAPNLRMPFFFLCCSQFCPGLTIIVWRGLLFEFLRQKHSVRHILLLLKRFSMAWREKENQEQEKKMYTTDMEWQQSRHVFYRVWVCARSSLVNTYWMDYFGASVVSITILMVVISL